MATFTDTFKRKEVKYRLNATQHRAVLRAIEDRMVEDKFGRSRITSLYFDTATRDLIARSVEKPLYKEKLRVRWYGKAQRDGRVFVELKKKYKGIVYKRRVGCSNAAARVYLSRAATFKQACELFPLADAAQQAESLTSQSLQIAHEIDAFMKRYDRLRPSMFIVCERSAFAAAPGSDDEGLRITFDTGISYRDVLPGEEARSSYHPLLGLGEAIMEIKTATAFPMWLVEALNGCESYPSSFSKYGAAYEACDGAAGTVSEAAAGADGEQVAAGADVAADAEVCEWAEAGDAVSSAVAGTVVARSVAEAGGEANERVAVPAAVEAEAAAFDTKLENIPNDINVEDIDFERFDAAASASATSARSMNAGHANGYANAPASRASALDRVPFLDRPARSQRRGWYAKPPVYDATRALAVQQPAPEERLATAQNSQVRRVCAPGKGRHAAQRASKQRWTA